MIPLDEEFHEGIPEDSTTVHVMPFVQIEYNKTHIKPVYPIACNVLNAADLF